MTPALRLALPTPVEAFAVFECYSLVCVTTDAGRLTRINISYSSPGVCLFDCYYLAKWMLCQQVCVSERNVLVIYIFIARV